MDTVPLPFIDLGAQFRAYETEIRAALDGVLQSGRFILGPEVERFERELADWVGAEDCVTCASGTDALVLSLLAGGVGPGDEVITTPFSFYATAEAVTVVGARPVFADIRPDTYTIDPAEVRKRLTDRTRAIIPVSIFGQTADMDEINTIARERNILVIEDAAQSMGARYRGVRSGNLAPLAATSFYPTKPLGCYGDGGAVFVRRDPELARELRILRNHGQSSTYVHVCTGLNSRLDALQAAVLRVKLRRLGEELERRDEVAKRYDELLVSIPGCTIPCVPEDRSCVYAQYSIQVPERDRVAAALKDRGIPTAVHYPRPINSQEPYASGDHRGSACPVAEGVCTRILSLPMHAFLEESAQHRVAEELSEIMKGVGHETSRPHRLRINGSQPLPHPEPILEHAPDGGL